MAAELPQGSDYARPAVQARRSALWMAGAAGFLLASVIGAVVGREAVTGVQRSWAYQRERAEKAEIEAKRQGDEADAVRRFLVQELLAQAAPDKNPQAG